MPSTANYILYVFNYSLYAFNYSLYAFNYSLYIALYPCKTMAGGKSKSIQALPGIYKPFSTY